MAAAAGQWRHEGMAWYDKQHFLSESDVHGGISILMKKVVKEKSAEGAQGETNVYIRRACGAVLRPEF